MSTPLRDTLTEPSIYLPTAATIADVRAVGKREKVFTFENPDISATMREESTPPERKAPRGTSLMRRLRTASFRRAMPSSSPVGSSKNSSPSGSSRWHSSMAVAGP